MNAGWKTFSGTKPCVFVWVKWPSVVAEAGGPLFPRMRAAIGETGRQNVHETAMGAQFHKQKSLETDNVGPCGTTFGRLMRSTKCARDCCESLISQQNG